MKRTVRLVLITVGSLLALAILVMALLLWQAYSWYNGAMESYAAKWPVTKLDADQIRAFDDKWGRAQADMKAGRAPTIELTPAELNHIFDTEAERKPKSGKEPETAYVAFEGSETVLMVTKKTEEGKYLNGRLIGDVRVRNGELWVRLDRVELGGKPAPGAVMYALRKKLPEAIKQQVDPNDPRNPVYAIRDLHREGDKAILVIDPERHAEKERLERK